MEKEREKVKWTEGDLGEGGGVGLRREKEREKVYAERAGGKLYII